MTSQPPAEQIQQITEILGLTEAQAVTLLKVRLLFESSEPDLTEP